MAALRGKNKQADMAYASQNNRFGFMTTQTGAWQRLLTTANWQHLKAPSNGYPYIDPTLLTFASLPTTNRFSVPSLTCPPTLRKCHLYASTSHSSTCSQPIKTSLSASPIAPPTWASLVTNALTSSPLSVEALSRPLPHPSEATSSTITSRTWILGGKCKQQHNNTEDNNGSPSNVNASNSNRASTTSQTQISSP